MPILNKTKRTAGIYNRGREVVKVYDHGKLAWQKSTAIPDYLCFTALEAGQFTLTIPAAVTPTYLSYVEWSKDGRNWNHTDNTSGEVVTIQVDVTSGDKVYWRGSGACTSSRTSTQENASTFASTAEFDVSGHIMSLLKGKGFADYENLTNYNTDGIYNYTFYGLFYGNQKVVNAADLVLPTFTSYHTRIFSNLFYGCSSLVSAPLLPNLVMSEYGYSSMFRNTAIATPPALPATTLANSCYSAMFYNCVNLTSAPALPARTLVRYCYQFMFALCSSLTAAPDLLAPTLLEYCYDRMFQNCSHINHVKCLATDISATSCLNGWLQGVSSTGTFIQADGVTWPRGASGIHTGWVDVEKRTMPSGYKQVEYLQAVKPYPSNYNAAIVGTGIILDPSQDTIEYAVWPRLDEDGYLINGGGSTVGEMPFANTSSPTTTTAKVGLFYILYRVNSSINLLSAFFTRVNGDGTNKALGFSLDATNKVTDNPQTIRVECSATSSVMYLNGTQVASRSGYTVDTSDMTTLQAFALAYNDKIYSWEHPFYYLKWWRGGTMIADYVPCVRESDDEVGFYDFVSQTFKTRYYTSSEPFTAGEEI